MRFCKVAVSVPFGTNLTCFSVSIRSLPWRAPYPRLPRRRWGSWLAALAARLKGQAPGRHFFRLHSYLLLPRSAPPGGGAGAAKPRLRGGTIAKPQQLPAERTASATPPQLAQRLQSLAGFPRAPGEQQRKEKDKPFRFVPNLHTSPHSAKPSCRSKGPSSSVP